MATWMLDRVVLLSMCWVKLGRGKDVRFSRWKCKRSWRGRKLLTFLELIILISINRLSSKCSMNRYFQLLSKYPSTQNSKHIKLLQISHLLKEKTLRPKWINNKILTAWLNFIKLPKYLYNMDMGSILPASMRSKVKSCNFSLKLVNQTHTITRLEK